MAVSVCRRVSFDGQQILQFHGSRCESVALMNYLTGRSKLILFSSCSTLARSGEVSRCEYSIGTIHSVCVRCALENKSGSTVFCPLSSPSPSGCSVTCFTASMVTLCGPLTAPGPSSYVINRYDPSPDSVQFAGRLPSCG